MSSAPLFGFAGRTQQDPERRIGRAAKLLGQDRGDLGRPQELVLDVDQALRSPERAQVGLENAEIAARDRPVDALRHRPDDLHVELARRVGARDRRELLAGHLMPAHAEVLGDVGDRRALDPSADVVPADSRPRNVLARVVAVARLRRQIDSADESNAVVDHDRLLVVTVKRPFLRVEPAVDPRVLASVGRASP